MLCNIFQRNHFLPRKRLRFNTPFTRSSKHRANVEQKYSKYTC